MGIDCRGVRGRGSLAGPNARKDKKTEAQGGQIFREIGRFFESYRKSLEKGRSFGIIGWTQGNARSEKKHRGTLAILVALSLSGCGKGLPNDESTASSTTRKLADSSRSGVKSETPKKSGADSIPLARVSNRPANAKGKVFVVEYHHIRSGKGPMFRTTTAFLGDLNRFYKDGFRPVTVAEYLSGKMPIGAGASPVVFTFDDANPSQFAILKDGTVDPNCAIGIWQRFAKSHPDFPVKGTFYVLPNMWNQPKLVQQKLAYLKSQGCEIGNHTVTHPILHKLSDEEVEQEIGGAELRIEKLGVPAPTSLAYPFGSSPKNSKLLHGFDYQGQPIKITNAMLVGAEPAPVPTDPKFNPYRIPRIQANSEPSGLDDWFKKFEAGRVKVYVHG
jgi:hypothetical protein